MKLLECRQLSRDFGAQAILNKLDFSIDPDDRIGLIGPNGSGKTTLLRILCGQDDDYRGGLQRHAELRIGYLPQVVEAAPDELVVDYMLADFHKAESALRAAENRLAALDSRKNQKSALDNYQRSLEAWEACGGANAPEQARRAMAQVGLADRIEVPVAVLSGGERGIMALARAVQGNPQLLILDEPGNHLDFWGMAWLESFLRAYKGAVLLVSHNRMLLDRVVTSIAELQNGGIIRHKGDYSSYRLEKLRNAASQGARWQADRKKIARLEAMVQFFAVLAATHTNQSGAVYGQRLRARRKQLEREQQAAETRPDLGSSRIQTSFAGNGAGGVKSDFALQVRSYSRAWDDKLLVADGSFTISRGEKIALIGANGCGKTTLLRDLVQSASWEHPSLRLTPSMKIGYVSQEAESLNRQHSIRESLAAIGLDTKAIYRLLNDFGFRDSDPDKAIACLSGGELNRLQLALAIQQEANFLVLDEPTNHLDIDARESIEDRLLEYDGTILMVSHDRYLIEKLADRLIIMENQTFSEYDGCLTSYMMERGNPLSASAPAQRSAKLTNREQTIRRQKSKMESSPIEDTILELERRKVQLEQLINEAVRDKKFADGRRLSNELQAVLEDIEKYHQKVSRYASLAYR
ncbi:MAG: ATP-binding cassette domain-containing protein [Spirochaetes bacterium]|nr:ATP-binding cassette domain-containing protein [Spirochaetota bacterium]MBU0956766.1 ATP-binding cassette domain-containing protein [Spirochaetota bacterium]